MVKVKNNVRMIASYSPALLIFVLISVEVILSLISLIGHNNNIYLIKESFYKCPTLQSVESDKEVILRIDDVQERAFVEPTKMMIEDAFEYNFPLVLGVIPNNLEADRDLVLFLKKRLCNLELGLHGWDHSINKEDLSTFEFENITKEDAKERVQKGKEKLQKLFHIQTTLFIPPGNLIDNDIDTVFKEENINIISANSGGDYDMGAFTYDFVNNKVVEIDEIVKSCNIKFNEGKVCVIVLHPQDYITHGKLDTKKYQKYIDLLNTASSEGWSVKKFSEL